MTRPKKKKREKQSILPNQDQNKKRVAIERPFSLCMECYQEAKYKVALQSALNFNRYTFLCKSCKRSHELDYVRDAVPDVTRCFWDPNQIVCTELGEI